MDGVTTQRSLVGHAVRGVAMARTPRKAAEAILGSCVAHAGAASGVLYLLDLATGRYTEFVRHQGAPGTGRGPEAVALRIPDSHILSTREFYAADPGSDPVAAADGCVIFGFREESCLGAIALEEPAGQRFSQEVLADLHTVADLIVPIYEDQFAFNLLGQLQEPLDYKQSEEDFFRDVVLLIALSSGMEFAALREYVDDALRCRALLGLSDEADRSAWDIALRPGSPFERAIAGETVTVRDVERLDPALRTRAPGTDPVRSYVVTPVRAGHDIFGVLSVGARCPHDYAPLEVRGFESVANSIGVAIANFRNSHELFGTVSEMTQAAVAITAMEVAVAARHEASGLIDSCQWKLTDLADKLGRHAALVETDIDELSEELHRANAALDRMKAATRRPERTLERVRLQQVWHDARTAVAGRLFASRIAVHYTGPDVEVEAYPDWLRHVFLNLLLNSIDAFKDAKKSGRRIELAVDKVAEKANSYEMTYRDNAGGINQQRLKVPTEYSHLPLQQLIFEPSVTSKPSGSGFGLWLVRRILADHHGSIDLQDHRQGVTFTIRLPKPSSARG